MKKLISTILAASLTIGTLAGGLLPVSEVSADTDYREELTAAGFPESYLDSLVALHETYPDWKFEAVETWLDWSTVIEKESKNGVNLVPKSGDDSTKSTASGAYDWTTNTWTVYDGSSWVGASSDYIAYYMDPRNFLNDTDIFQFESLSYNDSQTKAGVSAILKGSFMADSVTDTDGSTLDYATAFMSIGKSTGVSPYHLASRVRQEQGTAGTSSLISVNYTDYKGYFNYFNIGASGVSATAVIKNGLAYAKNAGWNTRYKSLLGGATILAKNYIAVGQDTLYFQKFNVVYEKSLYSHQYMANVTAAYSEGRKLGNGYTDKQQAFVFRIPVYTEMPDSAVSFTASGNPNNYLKTLDVGGQTLSPAFAGATTKYTVAVDSSATTVKITATAVASTSTLSGTGTKSLTGDSTVLKVKCTSESGSTKTYSITVTKGGSATGTTESTESTETTETVSKVPTSTSYKVGTSYITKVSPGTKAATFLKKFTAENATIKLFKSDGKTEQTDKVGTGNILALYDSSGNKLSSYKVVIYGDVNGDSAVDTLDLATLRNHLDNTAALTGCYLKAADANRGGDGVNIVDIIAINRHINGTATISQK
jgi:beta-N-acetylglucosaminidase